MTENRQQKNNAADESIRAGFKRWKRVIWVSLFLFWLAIGVFSAGAPFIELSPLRRTAPPPGMLSAVSRIFLSQLAAWLAWMALAPAVLWLRRRFPLERGALWWALLVHVLAIAALCMAHAAMVIGVMWLIVEGAISSPVPQFNLRLMAWWLRDLPFCALFYAMILGIGTAIEYYRQSRERELRASQLEAQLAQAQLQMLKMQLHPHFLFNTLNGITGLVRDNDNAAAVRMLVGLSELLRQTLDNSGKQEVRLSEELDWLELYLKLQQMRFSDRLKTYIEAEPQVMDALVPNLITQPLVENAIRHGLASRAAPGLLSLSAKRSDGRLELRVCDDGVGLPDDWQMETGQGLGLANTLARLQQLFGTDFKLDIRNRASGGVEAFLSIPLQVATTADASKQ